MGIIKALYLLIRAFLVPRLSLSAENLALRQQVAVYKHSAKRPRLRPRDRVFWVWLSQFWPNWRSALAIVQPETVIQWHRQGFKLYWRWRSRTKKPGRPPIEREIRELIRRMSRENPLWGAPRILSELLLLGHDVAEGTVAKYMVRSRKPPSRTWRTFLANHVPDIAACDFFTIPSPLCPLCLRTLVSPFPPDEFFGKDSHPQVAMHAADHSSPRTSFKTSSLT